MSFPFFEEMKLKLKLKWVSWCWTSWSFNAKFFMRYNCSFDKVVVFPFLLVLILCSWTLIYFNYDTATEFSNFPCVLIIWSLSLSVCARVRAQHKRMCACSRVCICLLFFLSQLLYWDAVFDFAVCIYLYHMYRLKLCYLRSILEVLQRQAPPTGIRSMKWELFLCLDVYSSVCMSCWNK